MSRQVFWVTILIFAFFTSFGQITGSTYRGQVVSDQGDMLIDAVVELYYEPTNTTFTNITDQNGKFSFPDVKAGGPYTIFVSYIGFNPFEKRDIFLDLGSKTSEIITLISQENLIDEVTVVYNRNQDRKGSGTHFAKTTIDKLPTLTNSLQDVTRLSAQANGNSFAGTNYRYNNLSVDGSANNDAFGFVENAVGAGGSQASGTPGSMSRTQPISLDAVQELQLAIAPYEVTLGNFTGGSINAVTKSGANKTNGSVYSFVKNQSTTGFSADEKRTKIHNFSDYLSGFSIGGAITKNKLFYFLNLEFNQRSEPTTFNAGSPESNFILADIQQLRDTIIKRYSYDANSYGDLRLHSSSSKVFCRLDWHISPKDQISLRHNFVEAQADHLTRSANIFNFGSQGFTHFSKTNSTVLEWKRTLSNRLFNKLIISHLHIDERRQSFSTSFPHIEIINGTAGTIFAGQYREAAIYKTNQRTLEFTDNISYSAGIHHFTFGTHHEYYDINYHFVTPYNGRWAYSSLDNFYANKPLRIRRTYNLTDNGFDYNYENPSASFGVLLSSLYAQDEISLLDARLNITYGLRIDASIFPTKIEPNADVVNTPEFEQFTQTLDSKYAIAPRFGFNYKMDKDNRTILRGGSGIFVGRMPFAWLSYPYIYNGNHYGSIDYLPKGNVVPLTSSVEELTFIQGKSKREINLLDPNLKLPQVWRSNLAISTTTKNGWFLELEALFTKTLQDAKFETRNLKSTSKPLSNWDSRPYYSGETINPDFTSVFLVTNTTEGYRYNTSLSVRKTYKKISAGTSYTYGHSKDIANGVRVSPQANWEWNQTLDPNKPQLSYSNFDIRHRIVGSGFYSFDITKKIPFSVGVVYLASSGIPYSYVYAGDANRDGSPTNDLVYVPANIEESGLVDIKNMQNQVILSATEQWANLQQYITNDPYLSSKKGQYTERNGPRSPWNQQLDARITFQYLLPKNQRIQLSLDLINLSNLISPTWGRQYFVPNTTNAGYSLLTFLKVENDKPQYRFDKPTALPYQYDLIASRMQGQIGLKYIF